MDCWVRFSLLMIYLLPLSLWLYASRNDVLDDQRGLSNIKSMSFALVIQVQWLLSIIIATIVIFKTFLYIYQPFCIISVTSYPFRDGPTTTTGLMDGTTSYGGICSCFFPRSPFFFRSYNEKFWSLLIDIIVFRVNLIQNFEKLNILPVQLMLDQ